MNLSELANFVCSKVRQTDTEAIAACKTFINSRYKFIWGDALWRDSIYQYNINLVLSGTADVNNHYSFNTEGHYLFPSYVDRVLAIRSSDGQLSVDNAEMAFGVDPDIFDETGTPVSFQVLAPCVWIHTSAAPIYISTTDSADDGLSVVVSGIDDDGNRFEETESSITYPTQTPSRDLLLVERITKPTTNAAVEVASIYSGPTTVTWASMTASDTRIDPKLHIRVLPKPVEDISYKVLIKKKPLELAASYDVPELRGVDNSLIAFAQGDMLERARQYTKAAEKFKEAQVMLDQLKRVNVHQEASHLRYVPWVSANEDPWAAPLM